MVRVAVLRCGAPLVFARGRLATVIVECGRVTAGGVASVATDGSLSNVAVESFTTAGVAG
jgi:hypothetical protein